MELVSDCAGCGELVLRRKAVWVKDEPYHAPCVPVPTQPPQRHEEMCIVCWCMGWSAACGCGGPKL